MREVQIIVRDDLDGEPGAETYAFTWQGTAYEIDLSDAHADELSEFLQRYIDVARPGDEQKPKKKSNSGSGKGMTYEETLARRAGLKRIRRWAAEQGYTVGARARLPREVHEAYNEAHPDDQIPLAAYPSGYKIEKADD